MSNVVDNEDDETGDDDEKKKQKDKAKMPKTKKTTTTIKARRARGPRREKARVRAIMNSLVGQQFPDVALGLAVRHGDAAPCGHQGADQNDQKPISRRRRRPAARSDGRHTTAGHWR